MVRISKGCSSNDEPCEINDVENKCPHNNPGTEKPNQRHLKGRSTDRQANTEVLINLLIGVFKELSQRIKRIYYFILNDLEVNQIIDRFAQWCVQHPQMAICLLAAGLIVSLPIFMFMVFVLSTIVMTLTGFLVLEGTILTIITMVMFGLLGALGIALLLFAVVGFATYFGVSHIYGIRNATVHERTNLGNATQEN